MNPFEHLPPRLLTRRQMLRQMGTSLGMLGFAALLNDAGVLVPEANAATANPLAARPPQFPPRAKHIIHVYLNGGPSQVDTFDPKPALTRWADKAIPTGNLTTERPTGAALPSPFKFSRYGKSGIEISELFSRTARHVDDICFIRSMQANTPNHEQSMRLMNCGDERLSRPSYDGFTVWLAGGGVKGGHVYGATDEFGYRAVENPVTSTICTPRCCTCSALIIRNSPAVTPGAIFG